MIVKARILPVHIPGKTDDDEQQPSIDGDGRLSNRDSADTGWPHRPSRRKDITGAKSSNVDGYGGGGCVAAAIRRAWSRKPPPAGVN